MADKKYNIKLSAVAGLVDNYNVFNLRKGTVSDSTDAYHNIKIQVFIDGKEYVENTAASIIHAGESSYKEFEGVQPTLQDGDWVVGNYGQALAYKLGQYITLPENYVNGPEIYGSASSYKSYKNLFKVEFEEEGTTYSGDDTYITYKQEEGSLHNKQCVDKTLEAISGESDSQYLYLSTSIIHFSKYYSVYSSIVGQVPQLVPLIQTIDDLAEYGLGLDLNNEPYIANLWGHKNWSGKSSGGENTYYKNFLYSYDPISNAYLVDTFWANLSATYSDKKHYVSMFKSNYWGAGTFREDVDDWDEKFPKGFVVFGIENENNVTICFQSKNTTGTGESRSTYPSDYTRIFDVPNSYYDFEYKYTRDEENVNGNKSLVALAYSPDSNGNPHVFNSWFPVTHSGTSGNNEKVNQTILYKSGLGDDKPKTLGIIAVSILANIYKYKDDTEGNVGYISDIVYLSKNTTSFIKDVVYKVRTLIEPTIHDGFTTNTNKLLVFNTFDYLDYLNAVRSKATEGVTVPITINYSNVNAKFKDGIKNIPLLFNMPYKEPNTDAVNQRDQLVLVTKITGESFPILRTEKLKSDRLYLLNIDEEGNEVIGSLDNLTIKFVKDITTSGPDITASWDEDVTPIRNEYIGGMFKLESGVMIPSTSRAVNSYGRYYAIGAHYDGHDDNGVKDIVRNEILIPYAKII